MEIILYLLIVALAAGLGACLVLLRRKGSHAEDLAHKVENERLASELVVMREQMTRLDKDLAVEKERSARLGEYERALRSANETRDASRTMVSDLERQLAVSSEARSTMQVSLAAALDRVATLENQNAEVEAERVRLKVADSEKATQLSERDALLKAKSEQISNLDQELRGASARLTTASNEIAALRETVDQERRQAEEKLQILNGAKDTLTNEFRVLANDLMTQHGEAFSKQNKDQVEALLTPVREKMQEFQQGLQVAHAETAKDRIALGEQIKHLSSVSAAMTSETSNLTRALKGKAQTQGAWGEMILATILEKSGLREGQEYHTQTSHSNDEGRRLRPDVIVNLPGGDRVIIDSKVSLVAFEAHINSETEEERALHLRKHADSIRAHIRSLSSKEYQSISASGLDYVVMFIPIEGAFAAATKEDADLILLAAECNVAIATPSTLMMALRTVNSLWRVETRNSNAEAIADRAGKLYAKFVSFLHDFTKVGERLTQASDSYQGALNKLSGGPGNLVRQIETLKEMGAKTSKTIPAALLGDESGSDDDEEERAA